MSGCKISQRTEGESKPVDGLDFPDIFYLSVHSLIIVFRNHIILCIYRIGKMLFDIRFQCLVSTR
ncbi:hypothetical protein PILCRDRAFT_409952 [Piloderma croceum F 1598]|uniref:Uncharacterized protein n=1 Tax=Piloderma croceum (strain F 1598) TaxID=765440 RepID=A0A0C3G0Y2_PILCF|nr:hypothetical protein PILCRDRAFT_409952 [Piloderma croceum F 1598]